MNEESNDTKRGRGTPQSQWVASIDIGNRNIDVEVVITPVGITVGDDLITWDDIDAAREAMQLGTREVSVKGGINGCGDTYGTVHYVPFMGHPECYDKTGTLIFRWEENA